MHCKFSFTFIEQHVIKYDHVSGWNSYMHMAFTIDAHVFQVAGIVVDYKWSLSGLEFGSDNYKDVMSQVSAIFSKYINDFIKHTFYLKI